MALGASEKLVNRLGIAASFETAIRFVLRKDEDKVNYSEVHFRNIDG